MTKNSKNTITVYWAAAPYDPKSESWSFLYSEPELVNQHFIKDSLPSNKLRICPALKDVNKNLFTIKSNFQEDFTISKDAIDNFDNIPQYAPISASGNIRLGLQKSRERQYKNYLNYNYNLGWLFFADQSVEMQTFSPFMPPSTPIEGGFLPSGKFDIGKWYRPVNLEYVVPTTSNYFKIDSNQDLIYLKFNTEKKIVFKKYLLTDELRELGKEFAESSIRYGAFKSLKERYLDAKKSKASEIVLSQIKKNVIE